jgi:hypothetical protein
MGTDMKVNLFDHAFAHVAYSVPDRTCSNIHWVRNPTAMSYRYPTVVTDRSLLALPVSTGPAPLIGWLLEGRAYGREVYERVPSFIDRLDMLLTHDQALLDAYPQKARFVPFGGCWIPDAEWGMRPKTKLVSMIFSAKDFMPGHHLRHEVAALGGLDLFGYGSDRPIKSKVEGLADYRFSVVIENDRADNYFTEKLIDCFALGTIPIYWGTPNIGKFFDERGILMVGNATDIAVELGELGNRDRYSPRLAAVESNLVEARKYRLPEDYIYTHYLKAYDRGEG